MIGRVIDLGALEDITAGDSVYGQAFVRAATEVGMPLAIPAVALMQAWSTAPSGSRPFIELLLGMPTVLVDDLTAEAARQAGTSTPAAVFDAAAAHTIHSARTRGWGVLSRDPGPLLAIDPNIDVERLP